MDSLQAESEEKQEMDDSGCIQDETPPSKRHANGLQEVSLLDLSDDVLLMILKHLAPRDLKSLGFTCPRLGALVLDRSLWQIVDGRAQPWGRARFRWFLVHALHEGTRELMVAGYAREARECLGHVSQTREDIEASKLLMGDKNNGREEDNNNQPDNGDRAQRIIDVPSLGPNAHLYIDDHRRGTTETYTCPRPSDPLADGTCPGPQFTVSQRTLRQLADTCPALVSLALEYCNINCDCTSIGMFPHTLKTLSFRGSKCYNLPLDRSFLFKIQDSMPNLESLDVSECEWMEPATLLPLSKLPILKHLYARDCLRLTEFVAYASLATRYGFTKLESLDLRGSPVGDSEVSALGWLAHLSRLWLSPARDAPTPPQHSHLQRDGLPSPVEPRDRWEEEEPEYFKIKDADCESTGTSEKNSNENKHTWQARVNGNSSDYTSTIPTALSSTISSPTTIINASPMRPGTSNDSAASGSCNLNSRAANSTTDSVQPGSSNSSKTENSTTISASIRPGSSNDISGSRAANSTSNPTMVIHASPARPGSSNDNTIASIALSPSISITRAYPTPKCCNIITPYSSLHLRRPLNVSKAPKRKNVNPSPGNSKRKRDDDSSTDDDDVPLNSLIKKNVNEGASTSKGAKDNEGEEDDGQEEEEAQPRHHVLYVNVGQRLHAVYRLSLDNEHVVSLNRNSNANRSRSRSIFMSPPGGHIDASSLVTDSAIRRFGRADGEDINYVHIGPNGPYPGAQVPGARPDRSSLTHLTVTGFRTITDRSLEHLATSAPLLRSLDLTDTNVTDAGVATFRSLRPDCEVIYSKFEEKD